MTLTHSTPKFPRPVTLTLVPLSQNGARQLRIIFDQFWIPICAQFFEVRPFKLGARNSAGIFGNRYRLFWKSVPVVFWLILVLIVSRIRFVQKYPGLNVFVQKHSGLNYPGLNENRPDFSNREKDRILKTLILIWSQFAKSYTLAILVWNGSYILYII